MRSILLKRGRSADGAEGKRPQLRRTSRSSPRSSPRPWTRPGVTHRTNSRTCPRTSSLGRTFKRPAFAVAGPGSSRGATSEREASGLALADVPLCGFATCGVRKYDLAAKGADPDGGRVYAPHSDEIVPNDDGKI